MNSVVLHDVQPFFAPVSYSQIDALVSEYQSKLLKIDTILEVVNSDLREVLEYFTAGNSERSSLADTISAQRIFRRAGAVAALNADFWSRALKLTDVYDFMPQQRRNEWGEQIRNPQGIKAAKLQEYEIERGAVQQEWKVEPLPAFEADVVRGTLGSLLNLRATFFAERVDGIFRAFSRTHLTNSPAGFSQRFIISGVLSQYGHVEWSKAGVINDLRCVLARLAGRPEPTHDASRPVVEIGKQQSGKWLDVDGGAFRIRRLHRRAAPRATGVGESHGC